MINFVTPPHPQKLIIDLLFKNDRIRKHVANVKTPLFHFYVDIINVWSLAPQTFKTDHLTYKCSFKISRKKYKIFSIFENFRWFRGLVLTDELAELAENLENFVLSTDKRLACYFTELKLIFLSLKSVKLNQYCFLQHRSCDTRIDFYHLFIYLPLTKNVLHSFKQKKS